MASACRHGPSWRIAFCFGRKLYHFNMGKVSEEEAKAKKADVEARLRRIKSGEETIIDAGILAHMQYGGKEPAKISTCELRDLAKEYLEFKEPRLTHGGNMAARVEMRNIVSGIGPQRQVVSIRFADLQAYADKRERKKISPETVRKEVGLLRRAWRWAFRFGKVASGPPEGRLEHIGVAIKPTGYISLSEAERAITRGQNAKLLFRSVYLDREEIGDLLEIVRRKRLPWWTYPLFVFAAHTGARRSEMLRAEVGDVDLETNVITIRERKKEASTLTRRRVAMTPLLREVLAPLLARPGLLFPSQFGKALNGSSAEKYFHRGIAGTRYKGLCGWHALRHSYISALVAAGIDQRIIDDLVGHSTEQQRRRYRHLAPGTIQDAIASVFGPKPTPPPTTPQIYNPAAESA